MADLKVVSLVLLIVTAVILVISLSTRYWEGWSYSHYGLWGYDASDGIEATRAFLIIAFLLLLAAILFQILEKWVQDVQMPMDKQKLTAILTFCAAGSAILAMIIFTGITEDRGSSSYSWSYILGWVAVLLCLFAGFVAWKA